MDITQELKQADKSRKKGPSPKLRGHPRDDPRVRVSKSLSWLLRHGAKNAGLDMRDDGYAKVSDVLSNPMFRDINFSQLQEIVDKDQKQRFHLLAEPRSSDSPSDIWWIRANQGHSLQTVTLDMQPITSALDVPMAVHGTTLSAWELIATQGLSKMKRNHIHLAQGIPGDNVMSGMRNSSQILIFVDLQKALDAGVLFYLSANGVVLTEGNEGFLSPTYFQRVEFAKGRLPVPGWEGAGPVVPRAPLTQSSLPVQDLQVTQSDPSTSESI
ncbi:KptA family-domain-containing protein [Suillus fuscotomentosus]|uniref:2'-phosphotransferase n=1 Tax=Suillus fuscotomentosus TaxID=1912939 RepID=A0AAD4E2T6_9AGAM|nr:KptA family-domain-containing protein [Suillus fuscotomentosus]KAG1898567.1 KptA family-domain-containing protein [Suillus fuscotomentosus]